MLHQLHRVLVFDDACSLLLLIVILTILGNSMVHDKPNLRTWGLRLAAFGFVAFWVHLVIRERTITAEELLAKAFRSLLAAGLILGVGWVVLPIIAFLWKFVAGPWHRLKQRLAEWKQGAAARQGEQAARDEELRRQQEYDRDSPFREQLATEQATAQSRREKARAACELLFTQHAHTIGERFPRQAFDDFMARYMNDNVDAEIVEQRAQELELVIRSHVEEAGGIRKRMSLTERATDLDRDLKELEDSNLDPRTKQTMASLLKKQFLAQLQRQMEEP